MEITNRDKEILNFINEFGFVNITHIIRNYSIKEKNAYRIINRLFRAKLINQKRIFHNQKGVYYVTAEGASWSNLSPLETVSTFRIEHNLKLADVYIALRQKYLDIEWISERQIMKTEYTKAFHRKKHIPDGCLILNSQKKIAIEVELTLKSETRLKKIFNYYFTNETFDEVWYYCQPNILEQLKQLAKSIPYIKIYNLEEILHDQ